MSEHKSPQESFRSNQTKSESVHSILLIDDCIDALAVQKITLEWEGFEVFTADSGTKALEVLGEIKEPNLILLDMQMEDMSGLEFLKVLEKNQPEIIESVPVVFLTGMSEVPESRAVGFIRKPADIEKLVKMVRHFIAMGSQSCLNH